MRLRLKYVQIPLIILVLVLASNGQEAERFAVRGTVKLQDGSPATGATIRVISLSGYRLDIPEAKTDEQGNFVFQLRQGEWGISAYNVERGFPDAANALYGPNSLFGRKGYRSVAIVKTGEGLKTPDMQLRFDVPDAVIDWTPRSRRTGVQIKEFSYSVTWADDPNVFGRWSGSLPELLLVIPRHRVVITIGAPGYKEWSSAQISGAENGFSLPLGKRDRRTIYLDDQ